MYTLCNSRRRHLRHYSIYKFLILALVLLNTFAVRANSPLQGDRYLLAGLIDSTGERGLWEYRLRVPMPGIKITSETFVRVALVDSANSGGTSELQIVEVFDVVRVQLTGGISSEYFQNLQRVALSGRLSSEDKNLLRRYALAGNVSNVERELARRFGLDGVISSENNELELAYLRREEDQPQDIVDTLEIPESPVVIDDRSAWKRSRALLKRMESSVRAYVRSDRINRNDTGQNDSLLFVVRPYVSLALQQSRWSLTSHYEIETGEYIGGNSDRFVNHEVSSNFGWNASKDNGINVAAVYRNWHNRRTQQAIEDFNAGLVGDFDYDSLGVNVAWRHGSMRDRISYVVSAGQENTDIAGQESFGYSLNSHRIAATGLWRIQKRTTFLFETQYRDFDYEDTSGSREYLISSGIEIVNRRRLAARVVGGYHRKQHEVGGADAGLFGWNIDLTWRPLKQTTLGFQSVREFLEVYAKESDSRKDGFGIQQSATVNWQQGWTSKILSDLSFAFQHRDFRGFDRNEAAFQVLLGTRFLITPSLTICNVPLSLREIIPI